MTEANSLPCSNAKITREVFRGKQSPTLVFGVNMMAVSILMQLPYNLEYTFVMSFSIFTIPEIFCLLGKGATDWSISISFEIFPSIIPGVGQNTKIGRFAFSCISTADVLEDFLEVYSSIRFSD